MPAVITAQNVPVPNNVRIVLLKIVADAAYPTGGYDITSALTAANGVVSNAIFGLAQVRYLTTNGLVAVLRSDARKVSLHESTTGAPSGLVECAASSAHVSTSTIIDVVLFVTDSLGAAA